MGGTSKGTPQLSGHWAKKTFELDDNKYVAMFAFRLHWKAKYLRSQHHHEKKWEDNVFL